MNLQPSITEELICQTESDNKLENEKKITNWKIITYFVTCFYRKGTKTQFQHPHHWSNTDVAKNKDITLPYIQFLEMLLYNTVLWTLLPNTFNSPHDVLVFNKFRTSEWKLLQSGRNEQFPVFDNVHIQNGC